MDSPSPDLQRRVAALLKHRPLSWRRVERGYTPAQRWLVDLDNGSSCFIKAAADVDTGDWLRAEHYVYSKVKAPFLPQIAGWDDDGEAPLLLLEDLSKAFWPPPWTEGQIEAVLATLAQIRRTSLNGVPNVLDFPGFHLLEGWQRVAHEPSPFLSLRLCSSSWLDRALPALD